MNSARKRKLDISHRSRRRLLTLTNLFLFYFLSLCLLFHDGFSRERIVQNEWQNAYPEVFMLPWTARNATSGAVQTDLYIELSPCELVYEIRGDRFQAAYDIEAAVFDESGEQRALQMIRDKVRFDTYEEIQSYDWNRYYKLSFSLPDGYYGFRLTVTDRNTGNVLIKEHLFTVDLNQAYGVDASDLVLAKKDNIEIPGQRRSNSILPYPQGVFGLTCRDMFYYYELYTPDPSAAETVRYSVYLVDAAHQQWPVGEGNHAVSRKRLPIMGRLDTEGLAPGDYRLVLELHRSGEPYHAQREARFTVFQSPVDLRFRTFEAVLAELRLIATAQEWDALAQNETSVTMAKQQNAVDDFWKRRDPTPETSRNEVMAEFYHRAATAELRFEAPYDDPHLTDRSKVYVLYGEPDEVQRYGDGSMMGYLEVWQYRSRDMEVVFQDNMGYGDYRLVNPGDLFGEVR